MKKEVLDEIKEMCKAIDTTESVYERGEIIALVDCLYYAFANDPIIKDLYEEVHKKDAYRFFEFAVLLLDKQQEIDDFMFNNSDLFNETIGVVKENEAYDVNKLVPLSNGNLICILESFLEHVDEKLFLFYQKMVKEGRILFNSACTTLFTSLNNSNTIISLCEFNNLKDIMIFVHELAHAYYIYINSIKAINREDLNECIKEEIPARILEKKFIDYMYQNGVIEQAAILENMYDDVTYKHNQRINYFDDVKYVIAKDVASNVKEKVDITKLFRMIHRKDFTELLKENKKKNNKRKVLV